MVIDRSAVELGTPSKATSAVGSAVGLPANRATHVSVGAGLQDDLCPGVVAGLAKVVVGLRASWTVGPGLLWGQVCAVDDDATTKVEKLIAGLLRESFLEFSQLLCGFEVLVLQLQQHDVVREQTLLGCQQFLVDLSDRNSRLVEVAHSQGGSSEFLRALEGGNRRGD